MSQDELVLQHLEDGNTITPMEAFKIAGTCALHSSISRLRKRGYAIQKIMRRENGKTFGEYFLAIPC